MNKTTHVKKLSFSPDVEQAHAEKLMSHTDRVRVSAVLGFFIFSCLVWFSQQMNFGLASASGLVIPDSVNLAGTLQELWIHHLLFNPTSGYLTIAVLYGWTWLIHPSFCFGVNVGLMLANIALLRRVVLLRLGAPSWSVLGLLANPYSSWLCQGRIKRYHCCC